MARTINQEEYTEKYNQILDVVQRLMYSKGFIQITIQEIQDELGISKGAFYHYFDSKQALLEALVERMIVQVERITRPILDNPDLSALEKFEQFFSSVSSWKSTQKPFVVALMRVWFADDNAIVRQKVNQKMRRNIAPLFGQIAHQGIQEGVFGTPYPDQIGEVILSLLTGLQNTIGEVMLAAETEDNPEHHIAELVATYEVHMDAMERALGAPQAVLFRLDEDTARIWINAVIENPA